MPYPVTPDFNEKMKALERRIYAKAVIDYTDPFLDQSIQVAVSEQANVSYSAQVADSVAEPFAKIASLDGSCTLDGTYALAPDPAEADTHQMGWWGSQLAGAGGTFSAPYPALTVTHQPRPVRTLKVIGDAKRGEWPADFEIRLYAQDDTLLRTESVTGNTDVAWSATLPAPVLDVAKQVLTITRWSHAGRQAKVLEFFTSIQETYLAGDLVSFNLLEESEASQGSLPVGNISSNEITLVLNNENKKFDVDNEQSPLKNLLKPNRRIQVWLGVEDVIGEWHTEIEQSSYYYQARLCGERYVAQGFKPVGSLVGAREVWAYVLSSSTGKEGSPPDVHFHVYSNNEGVPGESISTDYGVVTGDNWPSGRQWVGTKIVLDEPLQEGQQYWLVLAGQGVYDNYDNVRCVHSDSDEYADGYMCTSSNGFWLLRYPWDLAFSLDAPIYKDEWVPLGTFWTLDDWDAPDDSLKATVTARDRLELLRKGTYQSSQVLTNTSLGALAELVLQDAGLASSEYHIDTALYSVIVPYAWFEPVSHREALRLIAEAGLAVVYCDRLGVVRMEAFDSGGTEVAMDFATGRDYFRTRTPVRPSQVINEVIVTTQPLRPAAVAEEVYKSNEPISIPAGQTVAVTVHYNQPPVIEAAASLDSPPAGVSIVGVTYYGWGAEVSIYNANGSAQQVTLVINGKPLSVMNRERAVARDDQSIIENAVLRYEFPANHLIQVLSQAQAIADTLLASGKDPRRDIEIDWRGNPALLLGDRITAKGADYHVTANDIEWAGSLRQTTTGRRVV